MEKARAELMAVLTPDLMRASPSRAAEAQFYFDCWVEQQEENWQTDDIAYCRDNLTKSLHELHGMAPPMGGPVAEEPAPAPKPKVKKKTPKAEKEPAKE